MKKSLSKGLILAAVVAMLMAALAPGASAKSRGDTLKAAPAEAKHEICILEGANICPPEPFDIVIPCITINLLAGEECPDFNEDEVDPGSEMLAVATAETKHEICIVDGANICPPEPFEHIAICVTTSLLAGDECPHVPEDEVDPGVGSLARVARS